MQNLEEQELADGDGREDTVAPEGIAGLLTRAHDGFWLQLGRPRCFESPQHGGDIGYHRSTPCTRCDHKPLHTGDTLVDQHRSQPYKLPTYP